ncbi:MAG: radical SAM protein [Oscillospiraceae bacterium]|nr:radical SAM protein [Oscillospiraceae bacterium]
MKKTNASIFIPHLGCPHKCSFCNKNAITEKAKSVTALDIRTILDEHVLSLNRRKMSAEIAFFGGTFTALENDYREQLLTVANEYLQKHDVFTGIRISTRPDYINEAVLAQLNRFGVTAIELGAQSMDDEVLSANNRGHSSESVRASAKLIKNYEFELGLQMMTGLYKDTYEKSLYTADELIKLNPDTVRIYPLEVFEGTRLFEIGHTPFSQEETIELCSEIYKRLVQNNIRVIRIGLNYPGNIIGELIIGRYYFNKIYEFMKNAGSNKFRIFTDKRNISKINGHKGENKRKLEELGFTYRIKEKQGEELKIHVL